MFFIKDKYVFGMALVRFASALLEFTAAVLFLKLNDVRWAMRINAVMGFVGPLVFISVSMLGLLGIAGKVSLEKLVIILLGVVLVLIGTLK